MTQIEYYLTIEDDEIQTTTKIEEIDTEDDEFHICFRLPIKALSSAMWERVNKSVVMAKREYYNNTRNQRKWISDGFDNVEYHYLVLSVWVDKNGITYNISCGFNDIKDVLLEEFVNVPIDLHRYDDKVRSLVHQYIDDTFFMVVKN